MKQFCQSGNLSSFINVDELPDLLKPHLSQLQELLHPEGFERRTKESFRDFFQPLDAEVFKLLVLRLNADHSDDCLWVASDQWCNLSIEEAQLYRPVASEVNYQDRISFGEVVFATFDDNPNNCIVHLKSARSGTVSFGMISKIFTHQRMPAKEHDPVVSTWMSVECFHVILLSGLLT